MIIFIKIIYIKHVYGDWGLGIGDCNPQSPIPNPQLIINKNNLFSYNKKQLITHIL